MPVNLETGLSEQVERVRTLIDDLPLFDNQKTELRQYIHETSFVVASFSLSQRKVKILNAAIGKLYKRYDDAYESVRQCPAVSEWMSDPVDIVNRIWNHLIE